MGILLGLLELVVSLMMGILFGLIPVDILNDFINGQ